jgi:ATP-dependent exoDNAse (exonuclease V) alpha subunit
MFPCEFITGAAGTGKSTILRWRVERERQYGVLACTTGIAAVNLNAVTINSLLKYFDTASLVDAYNTKRLHRELRKLAKDYENLIIDEISMMELLQLQTIFNANSEIPQPLGMVLTGDFCQLPPVEGHFAFWAACWKYFEVRRLGQPYRQNDPAYLKALKFAREGNGRCAVEVLDQIATWAERLDEHFNGTTIVSTNQQVDELNFRRYALLPGTEHPYLSKRWGKTDSSWDNIPHELKLKQGAYVMILANEPPEFTYANGDCGTVVTCDGGPVVVRLTRNAKEVIVNYVVREVESKARPFGCSTTGDIGPNGEYFNSFRDRWIIGEITYLPIRLAYATTIHKSQGLTLDNAQLDIRDEFFGSFNFAYVALSRTRTAAGLRIVGAPGCLEKRIRIHPEVEHWV